METVEQLQEFKANLAETHNMVKAYIDTDKSNKEQILNIQNAMNDMSKKFEESRADYAVKEFNKSELIQRTKFVLANKSLLEAWNQNPSLRNAVDKSIVSRVEKACTQGLEPLIKQFENKYASVGVGIEPYVKAAMATGTAGAGAEWLQTVYALEVVDYLKEMMPVAKNFKWTTIKEGKLEKKRLTGLAGEGAYIFSLQGANLTAENGNNSVVGNVPTGSVTWSTFQVNAYHEVSYKFMINSAVSALTEVEKSIARQISQEVENGIVNGSKTAMATTYVGTANALNVVNNVDGFRYTALTNSTGVDCAGALTLAKLRSARQIMGVYGDYQEDLIAFYSRGAYYASLDLIKLYTDAGNYASVISGKVELIDGVLVRMGGYAMSKTLTTAFGKFDVTNPGSNTKNSVLIVYTPAFEGIQDEGLKITNEYDVKSGQYRFGGLYSWDFKRNDVSLAGTSPVGYLYNVT